MPMVTYHQLWLTVKLDTKFHHLAEKELLSHETPGSGHWLFSYLCYNPNETHLRSFENIRAATASRVCLCYHTARNILTGMSKTGRKHLIVTHATGSSNRYSNFPR